MTANEQHRTLIVGLGVVGQSLCRFLLGQGEQVVGNDAKSRASFTSAAELEELGVELLLGEHPHEVPAGVTRVVLSPGVPHLPLVDDAARKGIDVLGELDLVSPHLQGLVIAITGTNGKSTVTSLVGEMCASLGRPLFVGGNLGRPLIEAASSDAAGPDGIVVLELSSFQLEHVGAFRPHIAAILNVSDDHLDRYEDFVHYVDTKAALVRNQRSADRLVIPARPDLAAPIIEAPSVASAQSVLLRFAGPDGIVREQAGCIQNGQSGLSLRVDEVGLKGAHNIDNACAAALIAREAGASVGAIADVLRSYEGLPHRMKLVEVVEEVAFVNDSKATNVGAAVAALEGAKLGPEGRVVLIAGGRDKGGSYEPLVQALERKARALVVVGEASERIAHAVGSLVPIERAQSLEQAVNLAARHAQAGDMVLLAPACSSYDMFRSYIERGESFERAVRAYQRSRGAGQVRS